MSVATSCIPSELVVSIRKPGGIPLPSSATARTICPESVLRSSTRTSPLLRSANPCLRAFVISSFRIRPQGMAWSADKRDVLNLNLELDATGRNAGRAKHVARPSSVPRRPSSAASREPSSAPRCRSARARAGPAQIWSSNESGTWEASSSPCERDLEDIAHLLHTYLG